MAHATSPKRFSAVTAVTAVALLLGLEGRDALAQDQNLSRVNQDELASFYGRMNVVVGSGARAFGMGGAFLARADDATAASWNPAGLSYLRRTEVSVVGVHNDFLQIIPKVNQVNQITENVDTRDQLQGTLADFIGLAYPLRIKERTGAIQLSYQRSFSFSGSRRAEGPVGVPGFSSDGHRVLPTEFTVVGEGGFDSLSLSSGFEVHPRLRLGASANRWINGFSQTVDRPDAQTGGYRRIFSSWDISGTNFNLGALFIPTPKLNLGAVFKTPFGANLRLAKDREDQTAVANPQTGLKPPPDTNQFASDDVEIRFPAVYGFGASYRASNTLTVSADFTRTEWSESTIDGFFSLPRGSNSPTTPNGVDRYSTLPFPAVEEGEHGQADTNQWRAGVEWVMKFGQPGNVLFPLRAGFFRDGQPVVIRLNGADGKPLPEDQPSFWGVTAGLGVTVGGVLLDVAYIHEFGSVDASRANTGKADSTRTIRYNRVFASMIFRFGPRR